MLRTVLLAGDFVVNRQRQTRFMERNTQKKQIACECVTKPETICPCTYYESEKRSQLRSCKCSTFHLDKVYNQEPAGYHCRFFIVNLDGASDGLMSNFLILNIYFPMLGLDQQDIELDIC